jgi:hypothetical protein
MNFTVVQCRVAPAPQTVKDRGSVAVEPLHLHLHQLCRLPICLLYHQPYLIYTPPFQVVPAYLPKNYINGTSTLQTLSFNMPSWLQFSLVRGLPA